MQMRLTHSLIFYRQNKYNYTWGSNQKEFSQIEKLKILKFSLKNVWALNFFVCKSSKPKQRNPSFVKVSRTTSFSLNLLDNNGVVESEESHMEARAAEVSLHRS